MRRHAFPNTHREPVSNGNSQHQVYFEQIRSEGDHAQVLMDLVRDISVADFRAALQDSRIKDHYATPESAATRVAALERSATARRPVAAYLLSLEDAKYALEPFGVCVFAREQKQKIRDRNTRTLAAWYHSNAPRAQGLTQKSVARAIIVGAENIARTAKLQKLQTVTKAQSEKDRLIMPEAVLDMPKLFGYQDEGQVELAIEGITYCGTKYSKRIGN